MIYDEDGQCWTADHKDELFGWEIMYDQLHKAGVRRVMIQRMNESRIVYVSDPLAALADVEHTIERTMKDVQNSIAFEIEIQLKCEFKRIQREHLSRHSITLTDAMGSTFISIYAGEWSNAAMIDVIYQRFYDDERDIPTWLEQLGRLQNWSCRMGDLARVSVELEVTPLATAE